MQKRRGDQHTPGVMTIDQVKAIRSRAKPPGSPEEFRRDQELEHRLKCARHQIER